MFSWRFALYLPVPLAALALLLPQTANATPQDSEGWSTVIAQVPIDDEKKYKLYLEAQERLGNNWQRVATAQSRVALAYYAIPSFGIYGGYAWTPTFYDSQYHRSYRDEQRIWQQALYRYDGLGIQWQHRFRQEQRFITKTGEVSHRSRYMLRGTYALNEAKDFGLTGFDEFMIHLNDVHNGPSSGYDRNRFFLGPYWIRGPGRYEIGYLGEHLKRFGSEERWAHVIAVHMIFNF